MQGDHVLHHYYLSCTNHDICAILSEDDDGAENEASSDAEHDVLHDVHSVDRVELLLHPVHVITVCGRRLYDNQSITTHTRHACALDSHKESRRIVITVVGLVNVRRSFRWVVRSAKTTINSPKTVYLVTDC